MSDPSSVPPLGIEDIDRKYELLGKLAEGGMGAIYRARHQLLEEVRVIKTIRSQFKEDPDLQARFLREARVATQLRHPNIAAIHDLSVGEDGTACIVMEYVDGTTLLERQRAGPPLSLAEVLDVARQTLDALGYLHQRKVVHRDISPDNIMLEREPDGGLRVKLIDLGIAKPLEGNEWQTHTAMFIGKVRYASPEQLGGGDGEMALDGRSDLYSLGVVLYELLTGELPVRGTDQASLIAGHLFHPPRDFEETDPANRVSPALRAVVVKALAKSPADRFATAAEFIAALDAAERGETPAGGSAADRTLLQPPARPASPAAGPADEATVLERSTAPSGAASTPSDATVLDDGRRAGPASDAGSAGGAATARPEAAVGDATVLADAAATGTATGTDVPATRLTGPPSDGGAAAGPSRVSIPGGRLTWIALAVLVVAAAGLGILRLTAGGEAAGTADEPDAALSVPAGVDFGAYRALVVGNDNYEHAPKLETAGRDAREVARILEQDYGFDVRLLLDADRNELVTTLSEVAADAQPGSNLLVYYAGHGEMDAKNESGYWWPVDAEPFDTSNWVSTKYEVSAMLDRSPARRVLVVADSCYSGLLAGRGEPVVDPVEAEGVERLRELLGRRTRLALTSGGLAPVLDSGGGDHSVFAGALLEALAGGDAVTEVPELFERVRERVAASARELGGRQEPELAPIPRSEHGGGTFFFVREPAAEAAAGG